MKAHCEDVAQHLAVIGQNLNKSVFEMKKRRMMRRVCL
ncbi:Hypothetical protein BIBO1_2775 [Brucella inopinata BO1]|nr:Hypothetical protein BIBO1_2775 [Brucella inopinata BO1]